VDGRAFARRRVASTRFPNSAMARRRDELGHDDAVSHRQAPLASTIGMSRHPISKTARLGVTLGLFASSCRY